MKNTISLSGVDGSGKSTLIKILNHRLKNEGWVVTNYHFRYFILPRRNKRDAENQYAYLDFESAPPRLTKILSFIKLIYLAVDYLLGALVHLLKVGEDCKQISIFDRYKFELLVAPKRIGLWTPIWFTEIVFRFIPECEFNIFLVGEPEKIAFRKPEAPIAEIIKQEYDLRILASKRGDCLLVDTTSNSPEEAADLIQSWISAKRGSQKGD